MQPSFGYHSIIRTHDPHTAHTSATTYRIADLDRPYVERVLGIAHVIEYKLSLQENGHSWDVVEPFVEGGAIDSHVWDTTGLAVGPQC
jgi:hypothetical protein